MIDAVLCSPRSCGSRSNVVYSATHCPEKHTMSTAAAAALLR